MKPFVLFVIPNIPYPLVSGGHFRDWQILNILNKLSIKPHVLYFKAGEKYNLLPDKPVRNLVASLTYAGPRVECPDKSILDKIKRKLKYIKSIGNKNNFKLKKDFPFSYQYDAMGAGRIILEHAKKVQAKVVILRSFWCHYAPNLQKEGIKIIANCPDYNTNLAWEMVKCVKNPIKKIGPACNYFGVRAQERTYLPICDEVWVPTRKEFEEMETFIPEKKLLLFPNLIDVLSYPDFSREDVERDSLLFVGNYDYIPNANAAKLILTNIFPAVKRQCPFAKLYLIGKGLPANLQELSKQIPGVEAPGFVPDVKQYFKNAAIFICPVTEGGGMLFKVLEAISFGKAVVGVKESFRGISNGNNKAFISVKSIQEFVNKVCEILKSDEKRTFLSHSARDFALQELSWEKGKSILRSSSILNLS